MVMAMPMAIPIEVVTCVLPTCGGFVHREFGVSYAYGAAVAMTAAWYKHHLLPLQSTIATTTSTALATWHATALIFYGIRLCLFLAIRQRTSQRIQQLQKRIAQRDQPPSEKQSKNGKRNNHRFRFLSRTPFLLSCAFLYYGLCAPVYQTTTAAAAAAAAATQSTTAAVATQMSYSYMAQVGLVGLTWIGFLLAAVGDFTKSYVKARQGEDHLVTTGIFRFLRHPNYTGEMIGWTANSATGILAFLLSFSQPQFPSIKSWWYLLSNVVGVLGINFVLLMATKNLQQRQAEKYGHTKAYQTWVSQSWGGFTLQDKPTETTETTSPKKNKNKTSTNTISTTTLLGTDSLFTQVVSDVDDTLKSSGGVNIGGVALGGIDVQYTRGTMYPGVEMFMLQLSLCNRQDPINTPPPLIAILTARAEEFKAALELKESSSLAQAFQKAGQAEGIDNWGLGPVLYGSVAEWIVQDRKGLRKFTNFERLLEQDPTGRIMQYIYVGDTGEFDQEAGETMLRDYAPFVKAVFLHCVSGEEGPVDVPPPRFINGRPLVFFRTYVGAATAAVQLDLMTPAGLSKVIASATKQLESVPRDSSKWTDLNHDIEIATTVI
jgi:protein-S-isoprenylcysteine O-methyltransferase Ste14